MNLNSSRETNMGVLCKNFNHYDHTCKLLSSKPPKQASESKINTSLNSAADLSHLENENFLIKEITSTKLDLLNTSCSPSHLNLNLTDRHDQETAAPVASKSGKFLNSKFILSQTPECGLCKNLNAAQGHESQDAAAALMDEIVADMDSGIQSRPDSVDESLKKRLYQHAIDINQRSSGNPRAQRIQDSVSKIFGLDDPPAGFGLIYPKYYYLEQMKPQPMQPLKVWRGFNGNIYFEPIKFQNLPTTTAAPQTTTVTTTTTTSSAKNQQSAVNSTKNGNDEADLCNYENLDEVYFKESDLKNIKTREQLQAFIEDQLAHRKHLNTRESVHQKYHQLNDEAEDYVEYEGEEIGGDDEEEAEIKKATKHSTTKTRNHATIVESSSNKSRLLNSILKNRNHHYSKQKESSFLKQATAAPQTAVTHSAPFVKFEPNNSTVDENRTNSSSPEDEQGDETRHSHQLNNSTRGMATTTSFSSKYPLNASPTRAQTLFSSYMNSRNGQHYINGKIMTKGGDAGGAGGNNGGGGASRGDSSRDTIYYDEADMDKLRAAYSSNAQYQSQLQNANAHLFRPNGGSTSAMSQQTSRVILPNLSAVAKSNMPMKGLAFKEARHRIEYASTPFMDASSNLQNTQYYMLNEYDLTQARSRGATAFGSFNSNNNHVEAKSRQGVTPSRSYQLDMLPAHLYVNEDRESYAANANANATNDNTPVNLKLKSMEQKRPYKQMLKGLRKGVTLNYNNRNSSETSADIEASLAESIDMKDDKASSSNKLQQQARKKKALRSAPLRSEVVENGKSPATGVKPMNSLMMRLLNKRQQFNNIKVLKIKGDSLLSTTSKAASNDDHRHNHHLVTNTPNHTISTTPFTISPTRHRRSRESNSTFTSVTRYSHSNNAPASDENVNNKVREARSLSRRNTTNMNTNPSMRQKLNNSNMELTSSKPSKSETPQSVFLAINNFSRTTNHSEMKLETPDLNDKQREE